MDYEKRKISFLNHWRNIFQLLYEIGLDHAFTWSMENAIVK